MKCYLTTQSLNTHECPETKKRGEHADPEVPKKSSTTEKHIKKKWNEWTKCLLFVRETFK